MFLLCQTESLLLNFQIILFAKRCLISAQKVTKRTSPKSGIGNNKIMFVGEARRIRGDRTYKIA